MKNTIKVFGIIAIMVVIGFSMAACGDDDDNSGDGGGNGGKVKTLSGLVKANTNGSIYFSKGGDTYDQNAPVTFTTNIPGNETFEIDSSKVIMGLTVYQEYTWTATSIDFIKLGSNHDPDEGQVNILKD